MRPLLLIVALVAASAVLWFAKGNNVSGSDSIDYQGQQIKLSKSYSDFDDYKNDPNNIEPSEVAKVQQLVQSAAVVKLCSNRRKMIQAVFDLKFPGYGLSSFGEKPQADGSTLALSGIEIPKSGNTRYLLYRGSGGVYTLVDDFVFADSAAIGGAAANGDKLVYSTVQGATVVEHSSVRPPA